MREREHKGLTWMEILIVVGTSIAIAVLLLTGAFQQIHAIASR